jgi:homoserine dehydrogenase
MKILLFGFGFVGQAVARLIEQRRAALYGEHALAPSLVAVVDSGGAAVHPRGLDAEALIEAKRAHGTVGALPGHGFRDLDPLALLAESEAQVMVEATPTSVTATAPSLNRLKVAFRGGKHVVCVNKGPLAVAFPALLELARHNRVEFRFSGTVGGGTPVLALARECASGNRVIGVRAVLNGTTNFILSRMHQLGEDFDAALAEAIALGYAERDPSADVDGIDTATKLVILANGVLGRPCAIGDVAITGIRGVTRAMIEEARGRGQVIKLIAELSDALSVAPREVPADSPLNVPANLNALGLALETGGEVTLIGRGAGGPETATAILRDLIDIWHTIHSNGSAA